MGKIITSGILLLIGFVTCGQATLPYDIILSRQDGTTLNTSELSYDRYIIIDFWNEGCKPCIAQLNALSEIYDSLKSNSVEVLAVSTFPPSAASEKIAKKMDWKFVPYFDNTDKLFRKLRRGNVTVPLSMVYDTEWNRIYFNRGAGIRMKEFEGPIEAEMEKVFDALDNGRFDLLYTDLSGILGVIGD